MATSKEIRTQVEAGGCDAALRALYGAQPQVLARQRRRYSEALRRFEDYFGPGRQVRVYTAPGRAELGGNHTDHQHGYGLAAAVNLDLIAVVARNTDGYIRVKSYGFNKLDVIDLGCLGPQSNESTHSASLIRGIAEGCVLQGGAAGGFDAYTASDVLRGSGLSSSAAFETAIATILNQEYNQGRFTPVQVALLGQYAENRYFGKPSGLLDQLTSSLGGAVFADFAAPAAPVTEKIHTDGLLPEGMALCVTDTRGSHSELTGAFASIRREMEAVAACCGKQVLGQLPEAEFWARLPALRAQCGDRAVLRALHFYRENQRVAAQGKALRERRFAAFLALAQASGHSSFMYNQNVSCASTPHSQALAVALAVSEAVLAGSGGAWRMQGGGFAGTIQAFVPRQRLEAYRAAMEGVFGPGSCYLLQLREQGAGRVL